MRRERRAKREMAKIALLPFPICAPYSGYQTCFSHRDIRLVRPTRLFNFVYILIDLRGLAFA